MEKIILKKCLHFRGKSRHILVQMHWIKKITLYSSSTQKTTYRSEF